MGNQKSILEKNGYVIEKEDPLIVTKGDEKYVLKKMSLNEISRNDTEAITSEMEIIKSISHPHIVSCKDLITEQDIYYVVMDFCQGGTLASKIKDMKMPPRESEVLSWIVEICIALKTIHEKGLLHKDLTSENVFFTEFGIVCLGGFGKIHENSKNKSLPTRSSEQIHHLAPEVFTGETYDVKRTDGMCAKCAAEGHTVLHTDQDVLYKSGTSDVWSMGCILYELCTQQLAFSAETTIRLIPRIIGGPYPSLPTTFSSELCELLNNIFQRDPQSRLTPSEILEHPFILGCLKTKTKETLKELQARLEELRMLADGLERVHQNTTIGSLAGGVIGAVGGITSIVGLILAPFTLGASLIVTGVGVGVSVAGGVTAGTSNIAKMVNESSDRKAVQTLIKGIEQKINAVVIWLQEISKSLQTISRNHTCPGTPVTEDETVTQEDLARVGLRAGRGLGGVAELIRLVQVAGIGRVAAQATRAVRVAEAATGVLSGLFVAVDIFFIAMDAKEIHHIRQAQASRQSATSESSPSVSENRTNEATTFDKATLRIKNSEQDTSELQDQNPQIANPVRSKIMKFVQSIRQAADNLQEVLNDLNRITESMPSLGDKSEQEFQDMELMQD